MATEKPRFPVTLEPSVYDEVKKYRFKNNISSMSKAVARLVEVGIQTGPEGSQTPSDRKTNTAPSLSDEAVQLAETYDYVDDDGKRLLLVVAAEERKRTDRLRKEARSKRKEGNAPDPDAPARVIPLYLSPAAAGFASPAFGDDFDYIEVGGEVPAFADFAVKIDGDSMEPYIMDGSTVYVNGDPLANGDIGIFFYDGDTFCKQYYRDRMGNVRLLSLNRDRADADRFIPADSDLRLVCHGRVILPTKPRLAVPEEELK